MSIEDIREEAKIDLHSAPAVNHLPRVTNPVPNAPDRLTPYAEAICWCERWIERADVSPGTDPKRLAFDATAAWLAAHPEVDRR